MQNILPNALYSYLLNFNTKFKENKSHYWPSTLTNAQHIFFHYLEKKNFQDIIFDDCTELEQDLDFLNEYAREILEITKKQDCPQFPSLNNQEKSEILRNFRNHVISNWHIDEIFFSCGVYCCMEQLKSQKIPTIHFYFSIYHFLLNNPFSLQFYFFLKQNNIFLQDKKEASSVLISYLREKSITIPYDIKKTTTFLENFVLIWDLFEYDLSDYELLRKQFTNEIEFNQVQLNCTEKNIYSIKYFDMYSIENYISNKTYKTQ